MLLCMCTSSHLISKRLAVKHKTNYCNLLDSFTPSIYKYLAITQEPKQQLESIVL